MMATASRKKSHTKNYQALPPHSNEAHPLTRLGEANKTLVISIVVIFALVVLIILLFVANQFAGKAVALPPGILSPMSIGTLIQAPPPGQANVPSGEAFSFPIAANLAEAGISHETVAISFTVTLPAGVSCPTIENLLGWTPENGLVTDPAEIRCENNVITFTAATVNPFPVDGVGGAKSGAFDIARLSFNGLPQGNYQFTLSEVAVIDLATGRPLELQVTNPTIVILTPVYECRGAPPANANLCADDDQGLPANTPVSLGGSCTETRKCEYTCALPHIFQNGACVLPTFQCTGEQPPNTEVCANDAAGLTENTGIQVVSSCTETRKCEVTCASGYRLEGGVCVANVCTGAPPANADLCANDASGLNANTALSVVASCSDALKCEYTCQAEFILQDNACVPPPRQCTGSVPTNSALCEGDADGLLVDTARTLVADCGANKCEYTCAANYHLEGDACVVNTFICTLLPANANLCDGDDSGLAVNTPSALVSDCTALAKCEFQCQSGFTLQNGACVAVAPPPFALGTKIKVEEVAPADTLYQTKITATEEINSSFTIVTQLFTTDGRGGERSAVVEVRTIDPMIVNTVKLISTRSLGESIVKKRVVVYDTPDVSRWRVHLNNATFDVPYPAR